MTSPTVTVIVPTLREAQHIETTLGAVARQSYPNVVQVLVVDGRSDDGTRELAERCGATVLDNPQRIQAAALNVGLAAANGEIVVRVDGHCTIADDYVERCVEVLLETGAAMVGGAMTPVDTGGWSQAIAAAMASPIGAGPARFHRGGDAAWVDTVYLGAYRTELARSVGGYATDVGVNEDAEFALRMSAHGGVRFDPSIRSSYVPRDSLARVAQQFFRYGLSRAATVRRHPSSLAARQLAAPALVVGLLSPWRRLVAAAYVAVVAGETLRQARLVGRRAPRFPVVLPMMHLPWGVGFIVGIVDRRGTTIRRLTRTS